MRHTFFFVIAMTIVLLSAPLAHAFLNLGVNAPEGAFYMEIDYEEAGLFSLAREDIDSIMREEAYRGAAGRIGCTQGELTQYIDFNNMGGLYDCLQRKTGKESILNTELISFANKADDTLLNEQLTRMDMLESLQNDKMVKLFYNGNPGDESPFDVLWELKKIEALIAGPERVNIPTGKITDGNVPQYINLNDYVLNFGGDGNMWNMLVQEGEERDCSPQTLGWWEGEAYISANMSINLCTGVKTIRNPASSSDSTDTSILDSAINIYKAAEKHGQQPHQIAQSALGLWFETALANPLNSFLQDKVGTLVDKALNEFSDSDSDFLNDPMGEIGRSIFGDPDASNAEDKYFDDPNFENWMGYAVDSAFSQQDTSSNEVFNQNKTEYYMESIMNSIGMSENDSQNYADLNPADMIAGAWEAMWDLFVTDAQEASQESGTPNPPPSGRQGNIDRFERRYEMTELWQSWNSDAEPSEEESLQNWNISQVTSQDQVEEKNTEDQKKNYTFSNALRKTWTSVVQNSEPSWINWQFVLEGVPLRLGNDINFYKFYHSTVSLFDRLKNNFQNLWEKYEKWATDANNLQFKADIKKLVSQYETQDTDPNWQMGPEEVPFTQFFDTHSFEYQGCDDIGSVIGWSFLDCMDAQVLVESQNFEKLCTDNSMQDIVSVDGWSLQDACEDYVNDNLNKDAFDMLQDQYAVMEEMYAGGENVFNSFSQIFDEYMSTDYSYGGALNPYELTNFYHQVQNPDIMRDRSRQNTRLWGISHLSTSVLQKDTLINESQELFDQYNNQGCNVSSANENCGEILSEIADIQAQMERSNTRYANKWLQDQTNVQMMETLQEAENEMTNTAREAASQVYNDIELKAQYTADLADAINQINTMNIALYEDFNSVLDIMKSFLQLPVCEWKK